MFWFREPETYKIAEDCRCLSVWRPCSWSEPASCFSVHDSLVLYSGRSYVMFDIHGIKFKCTSYLRTIICLQVVSSIYCIVTAIFSYGRTTGDLTTILVSLHSISHVKTIHVGESLNPCFTSWKKMNGQGHRFSIPACFGSELSRAKK